MAFHSPPEVLLRTAVRAISNGMRQTPNIRQCQSSGRRFYRAAVCTKLGQPLEVKDIPKPDTVAEGKVLIAVQAAGINFADILMAQGKYQVRPKTPFTPGSEISGVVEEVGAGVDGFKKGDRIVTFPSAGGAFSQYCVVDPALDMLLPAPKRLSPVQSAAAVVSYGTAMLALSRTAQLKEGETVLITAAAGATGLAAVDIAKNLFKAEVIGVCGGQEKCDLLRKRGVTHCIDYKTEKIRDRVKEITGGKGVDVVMDQVGGDIFTDCLKSIAFEGRVVTVGYASGSIPTVSVNQLLLKSCSIRGVWWGNYAMRHPQAFMKSITDVLEAFEKGKLSPYVGKVFPLAKINEAFDYILKSKSTGKVVLQMTDEQDS